MAIKWCSYHYQESLLKHSTLENHTGARRTNSCLTYYRGVRNEFPNIEWNIIIKNQLELLTTEVSFIHQCCCQETAWWRKLRTREFKSTFYKTNCSLKYCFIPSETFHFQELPKKTFSSKFRYNIGLSNEWRSKERGLSTREYRLMKHQTPQS